ncbi:MAG: mannosyltransferase, partial [Solirubrobacteraceae bacterium]|nr:mannosyltransferase [Solirubrobacteraceae bacterium]
RSALPAGDRDEPVEHRELLQGSLTDGSNLTTMATIAPPRRPAVTLPERVTGNVRVLVPLAFGLIVAVSILLRTRAFGVGFWIDEGLSVGIANRDLAAIPGALRLDGSPPLYYVLLHFWIAVFGTSEGATHALSLLFAVLTIPAAAWAAHGLFGQRAAWIAAILAATNPFLTQYAQETRMYALVVLLATVACGAFGRAFALTGTEAEPSPGLRRRWAAVFGVALAALFYTHNWSLFFAAGCGAAWLGLLAVGGGARRDLLRDGLVGFGVAVLLWVPWLPTFAFQLQHTGAPWSEAPGLSDLLGVPGRLLGAVAQLGLLLAAGAGVLALLDPRGGRLSARGRATATMLSIGVGAVLAAWLASQVSPAWAPRYLAVALPPLLLFAVAGLAHSARLGLVGVIVVAVIWASDGAPSEKSNVREVAQSIAPSLHPGDIVVSTQPEQIPVLAYYLPPGLRYATLWGPVADTGVTDWRDGVQRLRGTNAQQDLAPLMNRMHSGQRLVLVEPVVNDIARWLAPWTELVRVRSTEWRQFVSNDPRFTATALRPSTFTTHSNQLRAMVLVKD